MSKCRHKPICYKHIPVPSKRTVESVLYQQKMYVKGKRCKYENTYCMYGL